MCPHGSSQLSDIATYWTDEELILSLDKIQHGSPYPSNVLVDVNPFEHKPSSLSGCSTKSLGGHSPLEILQEHLGTRTIPICGKTEMWTKLIFLDCFNDVWYFVVLGTEKETEKQYWKASGDDCQIYEDSKLTGWRSTLEFHEGPSDDGRKTDWVMLRYWINQKERCSLKDPSYLCRVFPCDEESRKQKRQRHLEFDIVRGQESPLQEEHDSCDTQNDTTKVNEVNVRDDNAKSSDPGENLDDLDCFSKGDYLELLDLVSPGSSASSSDSSSCVSMASDEVFDYLALLNDLEPDKSNEVQSSSTSYHLSVSMSSTPKVIVNPSSCDSLVVEHGHSPGEPLQSNHRPSGTVVEGKSDDKSVTALGGQNQKYVVVDSVDAPTTHKGLPNKGKSSDDRGAQEWTVQAAGGAVLKTDEGSSRQRLATDKGKKNARGKMKMLKMCFFPF